MFEVERRLLAYWLDPVAVMDDESERLWRSWSTEYGNATREEDMMRSGWPMIAYKFTVSKITGSR